MTNTEIYQKIYKGMKRAISKDAPNMIQSIKELDAASEVDKNVTNTASLLDMIIREQIVRCLPVVMANVLTELLDVEQTGDLNDQQLLARLRDSV